MDRQVLDGYYSSDYQCQGINIRCTPDNLITTNLGNLENVSFDRAGDATYNTLLYPRYIGKNYDDCKIAVQHANALERAGVYR